MENYIYNSEIPDNTGQEQCISQSRINPQNPFGNFTEYEDYNSDYSEIEPQILIPEYEIPFEPSKSERKRIRHFFNMTGIIILFHFLLINIFALGFSMLFEYITMKTDGVTPDNATPQYLQGLEDFMNNSSVSIGLNLLIFLICNLLAFFIGSKITHVKIPSYFRTKDLTFKAIALYCTITFFIRYAGGFAGVLFEILFNNADITGAADLMSYTNPKTIALTVIYTCIVAPVTEELMYRGFILKNLSRVSQRFGIFMSSVLFGLMHANISQFIFAFFMGIFLSHIVIKHNSIIPSIIVHAFANSVSIGISYSGILDNTAFTIIASLLLITLAIIGLYLLVHFIKRNRLPFTMPHQKLRNGTAISSVLLILSIAVYSVITILVTFPDLSLDSLLKQ